jgi:hypothetical protein
MLVFIKRTRGRDGSFSYLAPSCDDLRINGKRKCYFVN